MLRTIVIAALAACGAQPTPATATTNDAAYNEMLTRVAETLPTPTAEPPDEFEPTEPTIKPAESHWCCQSVDPKAKSGEGCNHISGSSEVINACAKYLNCPSGATKDDGKVTCISD